ncbi:RNA polymerase recycling motor HelD [Bacillus sp. BP-3]|uniref:RNA polymerase recycling motor HelD n=1 Tax=Bacillus sp. BP-3 TaxID=3022773 RepID=UPI00232AA4F9|nr:RNA polymerase recycling motor HelD [Bacillus sp. BP-3]MDC2864258.1 RNA polymerase recycling motor HelD [Bacillus sp. BP-3]
MEKYEQEWKREQKRIEEVVKKIKGRVESLQQYVSSGKKEVVHIRKNFWNDVTANFDNAEEAVETAASIKQQVELLAERERSHYHADKQLTMLKRLELSPYFGRIDFLEEGERSPDQIYLGIHSFFDESTEQFLVYDWRAPISSLYYDYSLGSAVYHAQDEMITGEITVKRQFLIRNGQMKSMFDTGVTIGDALLQEVLGKNANTQMKSIVSTIQKEQNLIIRNETSRLLIVQGAAGSGKTSAALQRVAYLLYRYRDTLHADQIVLFSPNSMFNSYISSVLPELGEENMRQTTFQEYLEEHIEKTFTIEDPFTQIEYVLAGKEDSEYLLRMHGIRYKASAHFVKIVDCYVNYLKQGGMIFKDVKFRGNVLISKEEIREKFYSFPQSMRIPNRIKLISEWLLKELKNRELLERKELWVEEEIQLLDKETYAKIHKKLQREKQYDANTFDDFEREQQLLAAMIVKKHFKQIRKRVKKFQFIHTASIYLQLFTDPLFVRKFIDVNNLPSDWKEICEETANRIRNFNMAYEDATPYLYLKDQLGDLQKNTSAKHIFIDEAQDYSVFQFTFLKRLFPHSKMTVLGDFNQTIHAHATENEFSQLYTLYGEEKSKKIELNRSYRSTKQIIEFTRQFISEGKGIKPFEREGRKPVITAVETDEELHQSIVTRIKDFKKNNHKTIAIICKTAEESKAAYGILQQHEQMHLIEKETASFDSGILIVPSYLAKGIEFDAVIIYNASNQQYRKESERKLFYTACTRAMHELYIYYKKELSPFLSAVNVNTYIQDK